MADLFVDTSLDLNCLLHVEYRGRASDELGLEGKRIWQAHGISPLLTLGPVATENGSFHYFADFSTPEDAKGAWLGLGNIQVTAPDGDLVFPFTSCMLLESTTWALKQYATLHDEWIASTGTVSDTPGDALPPITEPMSTDDQLAPLTADEVALLLHLEEQVEKEKAGALEAERELQIALEAKARLDEKLDWGTDLLSDGIQVLATLRNIVPLPPDSDLAVRSDNAVAEIGDFIRVVEAHRAHCAALGFYFPTTNSSSQ